MPRFRYKARDKYGAAIVGMMEADSQGAVGQHLTNIGYVPVSIKMEGLAYDLSRSLERYLRVRPEDIVVFNRQLATLVKAGIPILQGFRTLAQQTANPRLRRAVMDMYRLIEAGSSLSDAFAQHPAIFSEIYINTIRAGETGGFLDEALDRLSFLAEHDAETRAKVKTALRYPILVVAVMAVAFVIITAFVIPRFALLYSSFHATLPLPTRMLISFAHFVQRDWLLIVALFAGLLVAAYQYIHTEAGRVKWDSLKLKLPIFGPLVLKVSLSRFSYILGTLIRSGIPILRALEIVSHALGNIVLFRSVESLREQVEKGRGLSELMSANPLFPPLVSHMVAIGERTGELDLMLNKISEHYDMETNYAIRNLSATLEPMLILVLGAILVLLALAIFLPLWNMAHLIRR
ncbi:MAG: type II secretion system F family protein [candidate division NC10 bacterium]|nr:type II secretion system F family protein [candidate division NC10 bacterium]